MHKVYQPPELNEYEGAEKLALPACLLFFVESFADKSGVDVTATGINCCSLLTQIVCIKAPSANIK